MGICTVRILLADDHPGFSEIVERLLEPHLLEPPFQVVGKVKNGRDLVEAALKLQPDLIITDISMPLLNGIEAVRKLKESGSRAKVVFLTVHSDPDFVCACFAAGASGYVVKARMATDLSPAVR